MQRIWPNQIFIRIVISPARDFCLVIASLAYPFPRSFPGCRIRGDKDEFLSRPRFLAISEFGPQSTIYHEGSRYTISKVNLPISETGDGIATTQAKHCPACGYFHPESTGNQDRCERCHAQLDPPITPLFRLQNVSTRRREPDQLR